MHFHVENWRLLKYFDGERKKLLHYFQVSVTQTGVSGHRLVNYNRLLRLLQWFYKMCTAVPFVPAGGQAPSASVRDLTATGIITFVFPLFSGHTTAISSLLGPAKNQVYLAHASTLGRTQYTA